VDGTDLRRLDVAQWRRQVAWVPQDPTVFSGTVADNIALGEPGAGRGEVERAAAAAGATEFIDALPRGFDTVLGEGAATLSGGQRQRLAIARAHLRDAPVVILDEFTAHLDARTEAEVLVAASRLLVGRTALLIAHRTATARSADRIAVLEGGRIVESGTDAELLAAGGAWAGLCAAVPPVGS
jgi:ABC-type multidrug transport system fused ATPase/permease subunit